MPTPVNIKFFKTPSDLRAWFEKNSTKLREQWIGYYKKDSGKPSITWQESVDQALCFGWIDGIRKSVDEKRYTIRFTPRNPKSVWSAINISRVKELQKLGVMKEAGLRLFKNRDVKKSNLYSFEQRKNFSLPKKYLSTFQTRKNAWKIFSAMPHSYQRAAIWWILTAKKEETQNRRLQQLIKDSANNKSIPPLTRKK